MNKKTIFIPYSLTIQYLHIFKKTVKSIKHQNIKLKLHELKLTLMRCTYTYDTYKAKIKTKNLKKNANTKRSSDVEHSNIHTFKHSNIETFKHIHLQVQHFVTTSGIGIAIRNTLLAFPYNSIYLDRVDNSFILQNSCLIET